MWHTEKLDICEGEDYTNQQRNDVQETTRTLPSVRFIHIPQPQGHNYLVTIHIHQVKIHN